MFGIFLGKMNTKIRTVQPGGYMKGNFNKILAFIGFGWFTSALIIRYIVKPLRTKNRMEENQMLMNFLYDEQIKQNNADKNYEM